MFHEYEFPLFFLLLPLSSSSSGLAVYPESSYVHFSYLRFTDQFHGVAASSDSLQKLVLHLEPPPGKKSLRSLNSPSLSLSCFDPRYHFHHHSSWCFCYCSAIDIKYLLFHRQAALLRAGAQISSITQLSYKEMALQLSLVRREHRRLIQLLYRFWQYLLNDAIDLAVLDRCTKKK